MQEISVPTITMMASELFELVNEARNKSGESVIRRNDFIARCKDELEGEHYEIIVVQNPNRTTSEELKLSKDQCLYISMRESKSVRRIVVEKLNAMTSEFSLPKTFAEALRLAADQQETIEQQQLQIEQQKPAVEFLDRYVQAKADKGFREVAKILGIKEREFIQTLIDDSIVFRQNSSLLPYAHYQHSGYFTVKTGESNGHAFHQTRFTPAGIAWIAKRFVQ